MWPFTPESRRPRSARPSYRPRLESLEDRALPSSFGSLDTTYGQGGLVTTHIGSSYAEIRTMLLQPDGKLLAGGYSYDSRGNLDFTLARYLSTGALDSTFGTGGIVQTPPPRGVNSTQIFALALQSDGRIIAAGQAWVSSKKTSNDAEFEVVRYNANGTLDTTFGTTGIVFTNLSSDQDLANSVGIQSDGKIVVVGSQRVVTATSTYYQAEIIRYNSNGSLDTTLGSGGSVFNGSVSGAGPLFILSDGKYLVGAGNAGLSLARFLPSGQLDSSFGTNGISSGYVPPGTTGANTMNLILGSDGTIFDVGRAGPTSSLALAHFSSSGQFDSTFGNSGWVTDNFAGAGPAAWASNGDLILAGSSRNLNPADFALEAFLPNGTLDTSFGTNGRVTTDFGGDDGARAIIVQGDGRIVAAGFTGSGTYPGTPYEFALARYMPPPPVIGSFTASTNPVTSGSSLTLTVSNLTDPNAGSSITQVAIYLDSNNDGKLDTGDTLLGYATQTSPGVWSFTYTVNLSAGTYTLFAQAEDNSGLFSDPFALTLTVQ
jgi:uncharacterized delta-60 repeat protein